MFLVDEDRFEAMVVDALDSLPPPLAARMDNVVVCVEDGLPGGSLLGLYDGIPLTQRDDYGGFGSAPMPDTVTLFRLTICDACETEADVAHEVRVTLIHEVAHHFGIDDDRLTELGWD
jgi:predicted Zn-dependent protease with MMP-like domain